MARFEAFDVNSMTAEQLRELVVYEPYTGIFWLRDSNKPLGNKTCNGYVVFTLRGHTYRAHRLAWLYMTGNWPKNLVDHKDGDKANNKFSNLREATHQQNSYNGVRRKTNKSGFRGVCWNTKRQRWIAQIVVNGKTRYLGSFQIKEQAACVYQAAAHKHHGEFSHTLRPDIN